MLGAANALISPLRSLTLASVEMMGYWASTFLYGITRFLKFVTFKENSLRGAPFLCVLHKNNRILSNKFFKKVLTLTLMWSIMQLLTIMFREKVVTSEGVVNFGGVSYRRFLRLNGYATRKHGTSH